MFISIPQPVLALMDRLESAGHQVWVVGGCVRDSLLGLTPHDWDMCTDARPEETQAVFRAYPLVLAGVKHGTVAVVTEAGPVEITTFRTEGGYDDARHPGWVRFERDIGADLSRRDFTVNAMAYNPRAGLCDPWGGQHDLQNRILRAVGEAEKRFTEDGLRILRGVRFAARFRLQPEKKTLDAMIHLAHTLSGQARERVFAELCGFLPVAEVQDMLTFSPILVAAIPELGKLIHFNQHNPHHIYDVYTHSAHVLANTPPDLPLRWAALLHDVGKPDTFSMDEKGIGHFYGHARRSAELADGILRGLKAPNALRERVTTLIAHHSASRDCSRQENDKSLRRLLRKLGEETMHQLLLLDRADETGKGTPPDTAAGHRVEQMLQRILEEQPCLSVNRLAVNGRELMTLGIPQGRELGRILNRLLDEVTDGELENEKEALLLRARVLLEE